MVIETRYMKHSKTKIAPVPKDFPNKHTPMVFPIRYINIGSFLA